MLYVMIRGLITGTPRKLAMVALVLALFGLCSGVTLLGRYAFFNPGSILFFAIAVLVLIPATLKYIAWRRNGLTQPLPNNALLFQLDHVTGVDTQTNVVLNTRTTTTHGSTQAAVLTPPATGSQDVPVTCQICQQKIVFQVDSLEVRRARRLRTSLTWGGCFVLAIAVGIFSSDAVQTEPVSGWVGLLRIIYLILFLVSTIGIGTLLVYNGARYRRPLPRGHRVRLPEKHDLETFVTQQIPPIVITNEQH